MAFVGACSTLGTDAPAGFDLTGVWVIVATESDAPPDAQAIRQAEDRDVARGRQRNATASAAFVVQDFPVVAAERMEIEQNEDSMGIRYGTGIYRDISWGIHERNFWRVQSGWDEGVLHIVSERDDIKGRETMRLLDANRLEVVTDVATGGKDVRVRRVFDRR